MCWRIDIPYYVGAPVSGRTGAGLCRGYPPIVPSSSPAVPGGSCATSMVYGWWLFCPGYLIPWRGDCQWCDFLAIYGRAKTPPPGASLLFLSSLPTRFYPPPFLLQPSHEMYENDVVEVAAGALAFTCVVLLCMYHLPAWCAIESITSTSYGDPTKTTQVSALLLHLLPPHSFPQHLITRLPALRLPALKIYKD